MTEAEWRACAEPGPMLAFLRDRAGDRKPRLFAAACCRRVWHLLTDARSRAAVEVQERYADGAATPAELTAAQSAALRADADADAGFDPDDARPSAAAAAKEAAFGPGTPRDVEAGAHDAAHFAAEAAGLDRRDELGGAWRVGKADEQKAQADLIRDIFGNPFRPVSLNPAWRTSTTVALVAQMYESRDFSAMPILADALQDAGCDSDDILDHCRGDGPHVRGCWVVDLVLGKE
jgi:hypothetical protein